MSFRKPAKVNRSSQNCLETVSFGTVALLRFILVPEAITTANEGINPELSAIQNKIVDSTATAEDEVPLDSRLPQMREIDASAVTNFSIKVTWSITIPSTCYLLSTSMLIETTVICCSLKLKPKTVYIRLTSLMTLVQPRVCCQTDLSSTIAIYIIGN